MKKKGVEIYMMLVLKVKICHFQIACDIFSQTAPHEGLLDGFKRKVCNKS